MSLFNNDNIIKTLLLLFYIFVFLIIFEQYVCDRNFFKYYNIIHITICKNNGNPNPLIYFDLWNENGLIENFQSLLLFIAIIFLFITIKIKKKKDFIYFFLIIKLIGLIYFLGEEISWGQHFFRWDTPSFLKEINNQGETNLHNVSNLFDQLPRTFVVIWCSFSCIFAIIYKKIFRLNNSIFLILCPDKKLVYISVSLLIFVVPDFIFDKLNLIGNHLDTDGNILPYRMFFDLITFNFFRLSELHELIFAFYFFIYSICLKNVYKKLNFN
jgi:hypothetical protein